MKRTQPSQSRNWIFTVNNPTGLDNPLEWDVAYVIYQLELGKDMTPHLQGYCQFKTNKRLAAVKKIHPTAHWEPRMGTHEQAVAYCSKLETRINGPFENGDPIKGPGQRSDLIQMDEVKEHLDNGEPMTFILDNYFRLCSNHLRFFREYRCYTTNNRNFKSQAVAIWGPTGTGKSKWCADNFPQAYWKPNSNWWDGYEAQDCVVIDEFYGWIKYDQLLRLLDRYPLILETKGGSVNFVAKYIFIVSNKAPEEWYPKMDFAPLKRRLSAIKYKASLEEDFEDQYINQEGFDDIPPSSPAFPNPSTPPSTPIENLSPSSLSLINSINYDD